MKFDNNTEVLFSLLRAGLWEREARLSAFGIVDFSEVYKFAEFQSVIGVVAAGIEHVSDVKAPQAEVLQFVGAALQLEQRNQAMNGFIRKLVDQLRAANIYVLLLKGQGVAQCYEKPLWRACGDVDLFLSEDNYNKAKSFLSSLASSIETEETYKKHLGLTIDGWVVELHGNLNSSLSKRIEKELGKIYNDTFYYGNVRSWVNDGMSIFQLGYENDIVYVFTHILQHYFHGGIGLRQVCDWCRLLWSAKEVIDTKLLEKRLKRMGLISEWKAFAFFAVNELGLPIEAIPLYENKNRWMRKSDNIKKYILSSGNFGHRDMHYVKEAPYLVRKIRSFSSVLKDLFLHIKTFPYDSIRFFMYYTFIRMIAFRRGE